MRENKREIDGNFTGLAGASEATVYPGGNQSQGKDSIYQSGRRDFRSG